MTEVTAVVNEEQAPEKNNDVIVDDVSTLKAQLNEATKTIEALVGKKNELLAETKAAKDEKRKAAEANGQFKELYDQMVADKTKLEEQMNEWKRSTRQEKVQNAALKIASDLAEGANIKLLSKFIVENLDKLADESGSLSDVALAEVAKSFEQNTDYASVLKGNKSAGGSAPGNTRGAQENSKVVDRDSFMKMKPEQQMKHINAGGVVTG